MILVRIAVAGALLVGLLNIAAAAAAVSPWLGVAALVAGFIVVGIDKLSTPVTR